jgi:hypothetical protein
MKKLNLIKENIEPTPNQENKEDSFRERFRERLPDMSCPEFMELLSKTTENQTGYLFSKENADAVLEKSFLLWESLQQAKDANRFKEQSDLIGRLNFAISFEANKAGQDNKDASSFDNCFQSIIKLYQKHPEAARKFWSIFGQSANMVDPKMLVDGVAKIASSYEFDQDFKTDILHNFNLIYSAHSGGKDLDKIILSKLDFEQPENFYQTGIFLNFFKRLHSVSEDFMFSVNSQNDIKQLLQKIIADNKGSYLLNLRAKDLLSEMGSGAKNKDSGFLQYEIAPGVKAQYRNDEERAYIQKESQKMLPLDIADIKAVKDSEVTQENEETMFDFAYLSNPEIRKYIIDDIGIDISSISLPEQAYFLKMLKNKTYSEMEPVRDFTKKYGANGFKSFLSSEIDKNSGEKILKIGNALNLEDAQKIFAKTAEVIDFAEKESEKLAGIFFKHSSENIDMPKVKYEFLKKANGIIAKLSENIENKKSSIGEITSEIENSKVEIILLSSVLKSAKEQGQPVKIEEIKNLDFSINDFGEDMDPEDKQAVLEMARENWEKQNPELAKAVIAGLEQSLQDTSKQKSYILKYNGKVISYIKFEPREDNNTLFCGSFNTEPELRGLGIGDEMMVKSILTEAEKNTIIATVSPRIQAGTCYVEKINFVIDGIIPDYHETGEPLFTIRLDHEENKDYENSNDGKIPEEKITPKDIIEKYQKQKVENPEQNLQELINEPAIILRYDMKDNFSECLKAMRELLIEKNDKMEMVENQNLQNKYKVTRYFEDKNIEGMRYFVLEKI